MKQRVLQLGIYACICLVLGYGYIQANTNSISKEVSVIDYNDYKQIVYLDKDGLLIPVSYEISGFPTLQSEIKELFNLMQDAGSLKDELSPIVSKDTKLESVILEEDILQLHFKELHTNEELRFLEALTFTFCQLDGVSGIELFLNNEKLNQLPQGNILFNEPLTKALGINNFELGSERLYDTDSLVVYYAKTINKEEFYVPMTKRISSQSNLDDQLNSIVSEVSVSSTLSQASLLEGIQILEGSYLNEGHLYVNMNDAILLDETSINQDIYDLLLLSLSEIDEVSEVTLLVEGAPLETRPTIQVSQIAYNILKL